MKVEDYFEGENPLTGEEAGPRKIPKYLIGAMVVLVSVAGAQFGVSKLANLTGADQVEGTVAEV